MNTLRRWFIAGIAGLLVTVLLLLFEWAPGAEARGEWLLDAAWNNNTASAKFLVWTGTDVNFAINGYTALHGAAYKGNVELISFLIERGADIDLTAKFGVMPLWEARNNHQAAAERILLAHGANPDTSRIQLP